MYFFAIELSIKLLAADNPKNPNGFTTDFNKGRPVFINGPKSLPKDPLDIINFLICTLLNFISIDILFSISSFNLVACLVVKYNS